MQLRITNLYAAKQQKIEDFSQCFENTRKPNIVSDLGVFRVTQKLGGKDREGFNSFHELMSGSLEKKEKLSEFVIIHHKHLDSLNLVTKQSQSECLNSCQVVVNSGCDGIMTYNLQLKLELARVPTSSPSLFDCKQIIYKKFDAFGYSHLEALRDIVASLDVYEFPVSTLILPYIGAILPFSLFIFYINRLDGFNFFKTLFSSTIERIEKRKTYPIYKALVSLTFNQVVLTGAATASCIFAYKAFCAKILPQSVPVTMLVTVPVPQVSPMEVYKYTGYTGLFVEEFKLNTGAIVYNCFDVLNSYRGIIFYTMFAPLIEGAKSIYAPVSETVQKAVEEFRKRD